MELKRNKREKAFAKQETSRINVYEVATDQNLVLLGFLYDWVK